MASTAFAWNDSSTVTEERLCATEGKFCEMPDKVFNGSDEETMTVAACNERERRFQAGGTIDSADN